MKKDKSFVSILAPHIYSFIEWKKTLGFQYLDQSLLKAIDNLALELNLKKVTITQPFIEELLNKYPNDSEVTKYTKVGVLIQFTSYLSDLGLPAHIPKPLRRPRGSFQPYIYSKPELDQIFKTCDELNHLIKTKYTFAHTIPLVVRLLYGTGMRIGEVWSLLIDNLDLNEKLITITSSKSSIERYIPLSDSLFHACEEYLEFRKKINSNSKSAKYLFVLLNGNHLSYSSLCKMIRKTITSAGIKKLKNGMSPRIHDFRHTFAVNSIIQNDNSDDHTTSIAALSVFMGHTDIDSTYYYIRLVEDMFPDFVKIYDTTIIDVFPKLIPDEA